MTSNVRPSGWLTTHSAPARRLTDGGVSVQPCVTRRHLLADKRLYCQITPHVNSCYTLEIITAAQATTGQRPTEIMQQLVGLLRARFNPSAHEK